MAAAAVETKTPKLLDWSLAEGDILILGGGRVGSALARSGRDRCIVTHRSKEKVELSRETDGLRAVEFRLEDVETWDNLDLRGVVAAVITFDLRWSAHGLVLEQFLERLGDIPKLIYSTTSIYDASEGPLCIVREDSALVSDPERPILDRVTAEEFARSKGGTVLAIGGITGDDDDGIRRYFEGPTEKNGLSLLPLVNKLDIVSVTRFLIDGRASGERLTLCAGSFRLADLARALNVVSTSMVEAEPSGKSRIYSIAKLTKLLPSDFKWRSVLQSADVEPVSRGLPTPGEHGAGFDRQWNLLIENFRGKWSGPSFFYKRSGDGTLDLRTPAHTGAPTYHISFTDADTGTWHGTGLNAEPSEKILPLSRATSNASLSAVEFKGLGGQISPKLGAGRFGAEVNFFLERARTMIIVLYQAPAEEGSLGPVPPAEPASRKQLMLQTVCVTPFRCSFGSELPRSDEYVPIEELLKEADGWKGEQQSFVPGAPPPEEIKVACDNFDANSFLTAGSDSRVVHSFVEGAFISVPEAVEPGSSCTLLCGVLQKFGQQRSLRIFSMYFAEGGAAARWTLDEYTPQ